MAKLYRRGTNFYTHDPAVLVGTGPNRSYTITETFERPGWVAFDFLADVAFTESSEIGMGMFMVEINGKKRYSARGPYTWTRHYIFVDEGVNQISFKTDANYQASNTAYVRHVVCTVFHEQSYVGGIGSISPPKPLQQIQSFSILDGYTRYQRTGPGGTSIDFEAVFPSAEGYNQFIGDIDNFTILKCSFGVFGGVLIPQDAEPQRKGPLYIVKFRMLSSERAGVRVNGI